ncbi:MAG TPA: permease-like cell division protein FtsX [Rubricoccaceae bacterium]|nr:permease-like cell division protein FtsX [Rubricoccaceae bacterium]
MAVTALVVALVLMGLVALLVWQGRANAAYLLQRVGEVQVFLRPATPEATATLRQALVAHPGVDSVAYVSREQAAAIFREEFGEEADLFDDELFLPASFRVRLKRGWAVPDSLERFKAEIEGWPRVDEVAYEASLLQNVQRNVRVFSMVGLAVGLLVVFAALLLVGNTVRLTIYARRMLIRTMKLVGATNGFIRRPFLVEGVAQGLAAGLLAVPLLWTVYALLLRSVEPLRARGWPMGSPWPTLLGLVLVGALLGWFASWVAVRRFIRQVQIS